MFRILCCLTIVVLLTLNSSTISGQETVREHNFRECYEFMMGKKKLKDCEFVFAQLAPRRFSVGPFERVFRRCLDAGKGNRQTSVRLVRIWMWTEYQKYLNSDKEYLILESQNTMPPVLLKLMKKKQKSVVPTKIVSGIGCISAQTVGVNPVVCKCAITADSLYKIFESRLSYAHFLEVQFYREGLTGNDAKKFLKLIMP